MVNEVRNGVVTSTATKTMIVMMTVIIVRMVMMIVMVTVMMMSRIASIWFETNLSARCAIFS